MSEILIIKTQDDILVLHSLRPDTKIPLKYVTLIYHEGKTTLFYPVKKLYKFPENILSGIQKEIILLKLLDNPTLYSLIELPNKVIFSAITRDKYWDYQR